MKLAVTGAAGYLGSAIVDHALREGHEVVALMRYARIARLRPEAGHAQLLVVASELDDVDELAMHLSGCSAVIHAAAALGGPEDSQLRSTVEGTRVLVDAALAAGVRRVVGISSFSVYDYASLTDGAVLDENAALESRPQDRDAYARAKLRQEQEFHRFPAQGGELCILRPGILYDETRLWQFCLGQSLGTQRWLQMGLADAELPLVHRHTCAVAALAAAANPAVADAVLNIVDDRRVTRGAMIERLNAHAATRKITFVLPWTLHRGLAWTLEYTGIHRVLAALGLRVPGLLRLRALDARFKALRYDNARLRRLLGDVSRLKLEDALRVAQADSLDSGRRGV